MAERTYQVQKTQIGVETVPGTSVAATKQFQTTSIATEPQLTVQSFTPLGSKYPSVAVEQREWLIAALTGVPSYNELAYLLSSILGTTSVAPINDGGLATQAFTWTFDSAVNTEDTYKTFTIEQGDGVRAHRFSYAAVRELGFKFNKQSLELTGQVISQRLQDGVSLSGGVTSVPMIPFATGNMDVFIDPTSVTLGTTKLGRLFDGTFNLNNRYGAIWPVDSSLTSFGALVETAPSITFTMVVEADANGMAYLNTLRNGTTVFCRIRGTTLPPTTPYVGANGVINGAPLASTPRTDATASWTTTTALTDSSLVATDVGRLVTDASGLGRIPANTTLSSVTPGTSGVMSNAATVASGAQPGAVVGTAIPYQSILDLALKVNHVGRFSDQEGVYAIEFGFEGVADATWGKAIHWVMVNTLATL